MKILLAADGSECSEKAAQFLKQFHFTSRDEIVVLHVVSEIPYDDDSYSHLKHFIKRVAPKIISSSINILKPVRAKITGKEEEGYPDTTIIDVAEEIRADLIVMGARGVKRLKMLVLGSSTRSVAINSPLPLLVVKHLSEECAEIKSVLFATDGSKFADATGTILTNLPLPEKTEIVILNVTKPVMLEIPEKYISDMDDAAAALAGMKDLERAEAIIEKAKSQLSGKFSVTKVLTRSGNPATEILREAEKLKVNMIAVGSRGLRGIKGMLGSVSRNILTYSKCSILIGKTGERY